MSEIFTGRKGKFVELKDTIEGFSALLEGKGDDYPEAAFYMQGTLEEAFEEGKRLAMQAGKKWSSSFSLNLSFHKCTLFIHLIELKFIQITKIIILRSLISLYEGALSL